jgi:hypothetical protein
LDGSLWQTAKTHILVVMVLKLKAFCDSEMFLLLHEDVLMSFDLDDFLKLLISFRRCVL